MWIAINDFAKWFIGLLGFYVISFSVKVGSNIIYEDFLIVNKRESHFHIIAKIDKRFSHILSKFEVGGHHLYSDFSIHINKDYSWAKYFFNHNCFTRDQFFDEGSLIYEEFGDAAPEFLKFYSKDIFGNEYNFEAFLNGFNYSKEYGSKS